jgi:hypothetical protein
LHRCEVFFKMQDDSISKYENLLTYSLLNVKCFFILIFCQIYAM